MTDRGEISFGKTLIGFCIYSKNQGFKETFNLYMGTMNNLPAGLFKRPAGDACLCMGELQAPPAPHFVFLITL